LGIVLHLLCGFSIDETAAAFLKGPAAMEKRLVRAKAEISTSPELFDIAGAADVAARLPAVLHALYLLFNEGYHGACAQSAVRVELCREALRLVSLLTETQVTAGPVTHALAALLHLHAARLPARLDAAGDLILLAAQDRSLWDSAHIEQGRRHLELAAAGTEVSQYHVEAAIAELHARASSSTATDWAEIVRLYDLLMRIQPSPVVALNRAVAISQSEGPARGLAELGLIADRERLAQYPFYFSALGELELQLGHASRAQEWFDTAIKLARNPTERRFLEGRRNAADS
jgi:RNA polymerase sigma-70 factor (ECF subfamily)